LNLNFAGNGNGNTQMSVIKTKTQSPNVGPLNTRVCNFSEIQIQEPNAHAPSYFMVYGWCILVWGFVL
jgi:hypothetical protein